MTIACLLAVRNAEAELRDYIASVAPLTDLVVALDDGSSDETATALQDEPAVRRLLTNPRRSSHAGWDDRRNRQALLDAALELGVDWVVFLDADERLDEADAVALRGFLHGDAIRGCAYGLQLFRAWPGDLCQAPPTYVYRAFAPRPGDQLPRERLHFNPVPTSIQSRAWIKTTVRVRHLDSPERIVARARKYREADPRGEWERGPGPRLDAPQPTELAPWRPRPHGLPVLAVGQELERSTYDLVRDAPPRLGCLLPVRNGEADLPGYMESARGFADTVIALDDGSSDRTSEVLAAEPLVDLVLSNPRRESYAGWDDAANRQRLLDAAVEAGCDWVLFLDADERIAEGDGAALREFVNQAADPDCAYGLRVFRMVDPRHWDRASLWAYRLFAAREGQRLPDQTLHLVPVPTEIPRARWRRTTFRIQHFGAVDRDARRARLRKYEEADPELLWQHEYESLLDPGQEPREWLSRPSGMPALAGISPAAALEVETVRRGPSLSAIVISRDDEATIERCLASVVSQQCPVPLEVIVVVSGTDRTAEIVRERFPGVHLVRLPGVALPGAARNAGLRVAQGDYVSFPGSHVELLPGSLAARYEAHELGYPLVTGTVVNGTDTPAGWASYFLDHSGSLPGRPSGELGAAPSHCSYARDGLLELGGFPEVRAGEDTAVNNQLWRRGYGVYRASEARLVHHNRCSTPRRLARHHFERGRALGRVLRGDFREGRPGSRRALVAFLWPYPARRLRQVWFNVARWGDDELLRSFERVRPLVVLAVLAAWAGAMAEVLRPGAPEARRDPWATGLLDGLGVRVEERVALAELPGEPVSEGPELRAVPPL